MRSTAMLILLHGGRPLGSTRQEPSTRDLAQAGMAAGAGFGTGGYLHDRDQPNS